MSAPDLESDTAQLVEQLRSIYGLSEARARRIVSDPELAAMARSFVEGKIASDAALQRMEQAFTRLREALAQSGNRR